MSLIKSTPNNIYPPTIGNSLAVFVDINDGILKFKDQNGNTNTLSAYADYAESGVIMEGIGLGSTLRCGLNNNTIAPCSVVMGGELNKVGASGCYGTISGGFTNSAYGIGSSVSGGIFNVAGIGQGGGGCCDCCGVGLDIPIVEGIGISALIESCYSTIGGGCCNQSFGLASVVNGGANNMATSSYSSVGGGVCNSSYSAYSHIGGGQCNTICCMYGSILGGACNLVNHHFSSVVGCGITTTAECTFFANNICAITDMYVGGLTSGCAVCVGANGKLTNSAGGGGGVFALGSGVCSTQRSCVFNCAIGDYSGALGGFFNCACGCFSTIINGQCNRTRNGGSLIGVGSCNNIGNLGCSAIILGGLCNTASIYCSTIINGRINVASGSFATISNGYQNTASCTFSTILNGCNQTASGYSSTILNGRGQCALAVHSLIGGGQSHQICKAQMSTVLNGNQNRITSCGMHNAIVGGFLNNIGCIEIEASNIICYSSINNGFINCINGSFYNTISNGYCNITTGLSSSYDTIGTGCYNKIECVQFGTIINGLQNTLCLGNGRFGLIGTGTSNQTLAECSTILNGSNNSITSNSNGSSILAGRINTITEENGHIIGNANIIPLGQTNVHILGSGITANRCCTLFANNLSLTSLPISSAGLPSGAVWNNGGVLNIV